MYIFVFLAIVFILDFTLVVIPLLPLEILRSHHCPRDFENVSAHLMKSAMGVFLVGLFASVLSLFLI